MSEHRLERNCVRTDSRDLHGPQSRAWEFSYESYATLSKVALKLIWTILAFCPLSNSNCKVWETHRMISHVPKPFPQAGWVVGNDTKRLNTFNLLELGWNWESKLGNYPNEEAAVIPHWNEEQEGQPSSKKRNMPKWLVPHRGPIPTREGWPHSFWIKGVKTGRWMVRDGRSNLVHAMKCAHGRRPFGRFVWAKFLECLHDKTIYLVISWSPCGA